jgi:anti-sigma B factor antagonist
MAKYQFQLNDNHDVLSVTISDPKFDASGVREFKKQFDHYWDDRVNSVAFDLSAVRFIDSSGIGALLGIRKRVKGKKTPMIILNAQPTVVSIIELLHLQRVFTLRNT